MQAQVSPRIPKANKMQSTWTLPKIRIWTHPRPSEVCVSCPMCCAYQLAVAKASLGRSWASATFYSLLFAFCWPGGKHGGVDRKRSLSEILMLQTIFGSDSSGWVVCQKAEKNLGRQWNKEEERQRERKKKNFSSRIINSSETQFRIVWFLTKNSINGYNCWRMGDVTQLADFKSTLPTWTYN